MKNHSFLIIFTIIFSFSSFSLVHAQDQKLTKVTVHANVNAPIGDFGKDYDISIGFDGMIEHVFFENMPELALTASVHLINFDNKRNADIGRDVNDIQFQTFGIKAGALYYFLSLEQFEFFAGADMGLYLTKGLRTYYGNTGSGSMGNTGDQAEARFGFSPVVGGDYLMGSAFSVNVALRYNYLSSVTPKLTQNSQLVNIEIAPTFFSLYVGLALYF